MTKLSFEDWKREVDAEIKRRTTMTSEDLPDYPYRAAWEEGLTSKRVAAKAIQHAKREMGV